MAGMTGSLSFDDIPKLLTGSLSFDDIPKLCERKYNFQSSHPKESETTQQPTGPNPSNCYLACLSTHCKRTPDNAERIGTSQTVLCTDHWCLAPHTYLMHLIPDD